MHVSNMDWWVKVSFKWTNQWLAGYDLSDESPMWLQFTGTHKVTEEFFAKCWTNKFHKSDMWIWSTKAPKIRRITKPSYSGRRIREPCFAFKEDRTHLRLETKAKTTVAPSLYYDWIKLSIGKGTMEEFLMNTKELRWTVWTLVQI